MKFTFGILPFLSRILCFCGSLTLALFYSTEPAFAVSSDDKKNSKSIFRPINLFQDDTDRAIKETKVVSVPKSRPEKAFEEKARITLEDTLCIVDTHYPKLLQGKVEIDKAEAKTLEAQGAFDPVMQSVNEYKRIQDITKTGEFKNAVHNEARVILPTRSGIQLFAEYRVNPNDASSPILQTGRSGEYSGGAIIPLLRNFIVNPERAKEQKTKLGQPLAGVNLNLSRMNILYEASVAYWNWRVAHRKLEVINELLKLSIDRESLVRRRVNDGDLPALMIAEAEKEIRRRRGLALKLEREIASYGFKLSLYLWSNRNDSPPILTQDNLSNLQIDPARLEESAIEAGIARALAVRPELAAIAIQREILNVDLKVAKNMMLPKVDLIYRQGYDTGVNGIRNVFTGGVKMSVPLRQRKARGLIRQAKLDLTKLDLEEQLLKRKITLEVKDSASELNAAYDRFVQAGEELERARAVESGERQRFSLGDSSLFLVNRRERDRAETQEKRIDMLGQYLKALAAFQTVTGEI